MNSSPAAEVIVGRYVLYRQIGSGGMATVYFGRLLGPVGFSRTVAVKRLLPQYARDPEFVTMFLDEARLAARLRHPNIVPTLDVVTTQGEVFLVMEYVQGESLAQLMRASAERGAAIPQRIAASIVSGALLGLHAAHEARDSRGMPLNLVHRDVSPHNILVGVDGTARLLDFGVAKANGRAQHMTRDGRIKGKLGYMAPEHLAGETVARESDVYSAAVVLWEALAGRKLFAGAQEVAAFARASRPPIIEPPSAHRPQVTPAMDAVVMRGLAWDAHDRFATARDMAAALVKVVGPVSVLEVAEWVEGAVGSRIQERARELQAYESNSEALDWVKAEFDEPTPEASTPPTRRVPVPPASSGPMPIEITAERTCASTPHARDARLRFARMLATTATIGALVFIGAASFVSHRVRGGIAHRVAPAVEAPMPAAAATAPPALTFDSPAVPVSALPLAPPAPTAFAPAVPVSALPVASSRPPPTLAPPNRHPPLRRIVIVRPPPAARPPAKAPGSSGGASLDAIGGRE